MKRPGVTTHGHSSRKGATPTYTSWRSMKALCNNKSNPYFGASDVSYCERWNDFSNFLADMGLKPSGRGLSRKNKDIGYTLDNCYWATPKESAQHRSNKIRIPFEGKKLTAQEFADICGIHRQTLYEALYIKPKEEVITFYSQKYIKEKDL